MYCDEKVVCSARCNRVNGRRGAGGGVTKNNLGHLRAHNMQWWEVCSVQWKSGETVFSTKTAACIQCCLHTPVHTSVGFLGDILTAGQVQLQLMCVISSLAEVKLVQEDWVQCWGVCASFAGGAHSPNQRCAVPSGVCWCVRVWLGLAGTRCLRRAHEHTVSEPEEKAALQSFEARCTLHAPVNPSSLSWWLSRQVFEWILIWGCIDYWHYTSHGYWVSTNV